MLSCTHQITLEPEYGLTSVRHSASVAMGRVWSSPSGPTTYNYEKTREGNTGTFMKKAEQQVLDGADAYHLGAHQGTL